MRHLSETVGNIRRQSPSKLTLPLTPRNINNMNRDRLLQEYDRFGDYWAVWLGKASMLPEIYDRYSDEQLRAVINLASSSWARQNWKYHDYARYPDEHATFYEEFFRRWDELIDRLPGYAIWKRKSRKAKKSMKKHPRFSQTVSSKSRKSTRPSPSVSAAAQSIGYISIGNDGNEYVVKADRRGVRRWVKLNH